MQEALLVLALTYGSKAILWNEKNISRNRAVQMDNIRGLFSIRGMDRITNARINELLGMTKGVDERIDERVLRWPCGENGEGKDC